MATSRRARRIKEIVQKARKRPKVVARSRPAEPPPIVQTPPTTIGDAPVTISLSQLNDLQSQLRQAQTRSHTLEQDLAAAKALDPTGRVGKLQELARAALEVVRFAIANLPPSEIPKWPYGEVQQIADLLPDLPSFGQDDEILVTELQAFVEEITTQELLRARKRDELIAGAPAAAPKARVPKIDLHVVVDRSDGRCTCSAADTCPMGRTGSDERCTAVELVAAGITCVPQDIPNGTH